ncbi:chromate transporter [bacterium]|nr:chromate transporter [bacterium]
MDKSFYAIFKSFFKIGTLLLGGGYVILPLLTSELAEKKHWLTSEELYEFYALSTTLPGVIAINTAIFTGRRLLGRSGAIAALAGIITPSFLAIVLIATALGKIAGYISIKNLFWGVGIGVITLLFLAIKEMWTKCVNDKFSSIIYGVCLILALSGKISPAWIVIIAVICGIIYQQINNQKGGNN